MEIVRKYSERNPDISGYRIQQKVISNTNDIGLYIYQ